ncbi:hypothetical protein FOL46_009549 [Perkinsus olseni]|uniref:subtilisin n=1 Tax=Perkinsus olseni TaxID=32597 RepID=A0A7J6KZB5_PEROL|nr:hypothetical protein FOL46_009549 [Perkinsus olseni]
MINSDQLNGTVNNNKKNNKNNKKNNNDKDDITIHPLDPKYQKQWHHNIIGTDMAWRRTTGDGAVIVAVIDSGIDYEHPDLLGNLWINRHEIPDDNIDNDGNGFIDDVYGWNFIYNNNDIMDDNGHGTHISGIIGAQGSNAIGVTGIAWNIAIMPLKFLDANGSGRVSDAMRALNYAIQMGATISQNSWTCHGCEHTAIRMAIQKAGSAHGHVYVASAGNKAANNDNPLVPTIPCSFKLDNIICVGATDDAGKYTTWSNWGKTSVHLAAPGRSIYSTKPNSKYGWKSGTSQAAPMVAGVAALIRSINFYATPEDIKSAIINSVHVDPSLEMKCVSSGILNAHGALEIIVKGLERVDTTTKSPSTVVIPKTTTSKSSKGSSSNDDDDDDDSCGDAFCDRVAPRDNGAYCNTHSIPHPICQGSSIECEPCSSLPKPDSWALEAHSSTPPRTTSPLFRLHR